MVDKTRLSLMLVFAIGASFVYAESWTDSKGATWTYTPRESQSEWEPNSAILTGVTGASGDVEIPSSFTIHTEGHYDEYWNWIDGEDVYYSVMSIPYDLFANCKEIVSVKIPRYVMDVNGNAFRGCAKLIRFYMDTDEWGGSSYYETKNGLLFQGSELRLVPPGLEDVLIPEGVTYLNGNAFSYDSALKSITVPKTVTSVDTYWNWGRYPSIVYFEPGDGLRMRNMFEDAGFSEEGIQFKQRKEVVGNYKEVYEILGDGKHEWTIDNTVSADGGVSLRSGKIGDSEETHISFVVEGPKTISWKWKISSEKWYDYMHCYVDGNEYANNQGSTDWQPVSVTLGSGSHVIRISYEKDGGVSEGSDCGWVDGLLVKSDPSDAPASFIELFPVESDGSSAWTLDYSESYANGVSYKSPKIRDSQSTYITFKVKGEKNVSWWWKVSSENHYDYLHCYVDGVEKANNYGSSDWQNVKLELDGGTHEIKIAYIKDGSRSEGLDCGWVDGLIVRELVFSCMENKDGSVSISGLSNVPAKLTIPSLIEGKPVVALNDWLFECCENLASVTISNGVKRIGEGAFAECSSLSDIEIPRSIESIGRNAFRNTPFWKDSNDGLVVVKGCLLGIKGACETLVEVSSDVWLLADGCFDGCAAARSIYLPRNVQHIGVGAFSNCTGLRYVYVDDGEVANVRALLEASGFSTGGIDILEVNASRRWFYNVTGGTVTVTGVEPALGKVDVPETIEGLPVSGIAAGAFSECVDMKSVTIPASLTSIGDGAFAGCARLSRIEVAPGNLSFVVVDGVLYSKGMNRTVWVNPDRNVYQVPATITSIAPRAFENATALVEIDVPAGELSRVKSLIEASGLQLAGIGMREYKDIVLVPNGGTCDQSTVRVLVGDQYGELPCPTWDEHMFEGWFSEISAGSEVAGTTTVDASLSRLYAHWSRIEWLYSENGDNTLTITGCCQRVRGNVIIPAQIGGRVVSALGNGVFKRTELRSIVLPDTVTAIGYDAFYDCSRLVSVKMPATLESVGSRAFAYCESLAAVHIDDVAAWCRISFATQESNPLSRARHLYVGDDEVTNLVIPDGVKSISAYCFANCAGLETVLIPDGVETIGASAFAECSALSEVSLPESLKNVNGTAFKNTAFWDQLEDGFVVLNGLLCGYKGSLPTSLDIPSEVRVICDGAFQNAYQLKSVRFNDGLERIGKGAFGYCSGLTTISIPEGVTVVDNDAFYSCSGVTSITLPKTLKLIGESAFETAVSYNRRGPSGVAIEATDLVIGKRAFYYGGDSSSSDSAAICLIGSGIKVGDYAFAGYKHGNGVTLDLTGVSEIGNYAFEYAGYNSAYRYSDDGLYAVGSVTVQITKELKSAATNAFNWAAVGRLKVDSMDTVFALPGWLDFLSMRTSAGSPYEGFWCMLMVGDERVEQVEIPEGTESIPDFAFRGVRFSHFVVPESVKRIGNHAFGSCRATIQFKGAPPECEYRAFYACLSGGYLSHSNDWQNVIVDGAWNELLMHPGASLDFAGALNINGVEIAPASGWCVQSKETHEGNRALRAGCGANSLSCEIVGPAEVSFWWKMNKVTHGWASNSFGFSIDGSGYYGEPFEYIQDYANWVQVKTNLSAGVHKLLWRYHDASGNDYVNLGDYGLLDELAVLYSVRFDLGSLGTRIGGGALEQKVNCGCVAILPEVVVSDGYVFEGWDKEICAVDGPVTYVAQYRKVSIPEALGDDSLVCSNDEVYPWTVGSDSCGTYVRSGVISKNKSTALEITCRGKGSIVFWWRASSEIDEEDGSPCDYGAFYVDGVEKSLIAGDTIWKKVQANLGAGDHILRWEYQKDKSFDFGNDCIYLKDVQWTPEAVIASLGDLTTSFGMQSEVAKKITSEQQLAAFNTFLADCGITSAGLISSAQKQYAYQSFRLSEIATEPQLFEEEPVLKIDDLELTGGNLSLTISLTAGAESIRLAKDKLAERIRVGSTLGDITGKPKIVLNPAADGTSLTFTISPPAGNHGFVKVQID